MKIKMAHLLTATAVFFTLTHTANALVQPHGSKLDPRVQTVTYTKNNVINITAKVGHAVLIQLEDDERLDGDSASLGMGDATGWNLAVNGNNILFKPIVEQSNTNLIITTNKRTYLFQLQIDNNTNSPTYVLRFEYPDSKQKAKELELSKQRQAENVLVNNHYPFNSSQVKNTDYWGFGDKKLSPSALFDDGVFTYFVFNKNTALPLIYRKNPDGTENLVNKHVKGNTIVVQEVNKEFILRLGNLALGIENRNSNTDGNINYTGSTLHETVRINKEQSK